MYFICGSHLVSCAVSSILLSQFHCTSNVILFSLLCDLGLRFLRFNLVLHDFYLSWSLNWNLHIWNIVQIMSDALEFTIPFNIVLAWIWYIHNLVIDKNLVSWLTHDTLQSANKESSLSFLTTTPHNNAHLSYSILNLQCHGPVQLCSLITLLSLRKIQKVGLHPTKVEFHYALGPG
jgi:hypothetical protein